LAKFRVAVAGASVLMTFLGVTGPSMAQSAAGDSGARRDPFRPFFINQGIDVGVAARTPLQRYELQQLTVSAVMLGFDEPVAMVEDSTGMGFIVNPGTMIGTHGGVVTAIRPGRIVVEEKSIDFYGNPQVKRVTLRMPGEQGEADGRTPDDEAEESPPSDGEHGNDTQDEAQE